MSVAGWAITDSEVYRNLSLGVPLPGCAAGRLGGWLPLMVEEIWEVKKGGKLSKGLFVINICTKDGYVKEARNVYNSSS